jgi:hypothetical protein
MCSSNPKGPEFPSLRVEEGGGGGPRIHLVGLDRIVGNHIEGLEIDPTGGHHNPARLAAKRRDAASHQLQQHSLVLVLQPTRIEPFIRLMLLVNHPSCQPATDLCTCYCHLPDEAPLFPPYP